MYMEAKRQCHLIIYVLYGIFHVYFIEIRQVLCDLDLSDRYTLFSILVYLIPGPAI